MSRWVWSAKGSRPGGPRGLAGTPSGTTATGTTRLGEADDVAQLVGERGGDRGERGAEADRARGEQQVLERGIDRRRHRRPAGTRSVSAPTTTSTGAALIAPVAPALDLGEQLGGEPALRVRPAVLLPGPAHQVADRGRAAPGRARRRTPRAGGSPRSARTSPRRAPGRRARRGPASSVNSRHARCAWTTAKKSGVGHRVRSPRRRKVLTYMIRSSGWRAQWSNAGVPGSPSSFATSGVIAWNDVSGSSVSIS